MSGIEDVIGDEVAVALEQADARRRQVRRVRAGFGWDRLGMRTGYRGFATLYSGLYARLLAGTPSALAVPPGWCARRVWDRDAILVMPLWVAWLIDLWNARWALVRLAMRLGLWTVAEGDYYWDGRLACPRWLARAVWCFLNDRDRYEPPARLDLVGNRRIWIPYATCSSALAKLTPERLEALYRSIMEDAE